MLQIYAYTPFMWPLLLSGSLAAWLAWRIWRQRHALLNRIFACLMLAVAFWSLSYMLSILAADPPTKLFWTKATYLGIVPIGPLWFIFAAHYVQRTWLLQKWWVRAIIAVEMLAPMAVFTNELHALWWPSLRFVTSGPFPDFDVTRGPLFWLHTLISYALLLGGVLLYLDFYRTVTERYRRQTQLLIIGALIPLLGNVLVLSGSVPAGWRTIDITPFLLAVTGVIITLALFRYRLFDLMPVARIAVVDQMEDGVIVVDRQRRIVDINPAATQLLDLIVGEDLGHSIEDVVARANWRSALAQALSGAGGTAGSPEVIVAGEDQERTYEIGVSDLYDEGSNQRQGHIITLHDISEHKALQALMTRMMRITAHDLRTPLSMAVGYLSLVLETEAELSPQARANLKIVARGHERIGAIINDFLDLERVRSGAGMMQEVIVPHRLVEAVCAHLQPLAAARRQCIETRVEADLPHIRGDMRLLQQALGNLLTNALQYTVEGGQVYVSTYSDGEVLIFAVQDRGPGIAESHLPNLFEPFFQVPEQAIPGGGSGLGLSLVKAIVEAHGGRVWVESEVGRGSTFGFDLPAASP